jgi:CheY-like chemotaxis protein
MDSLSTLMAAGPMSIERLVELAPAIAASVRELHGELSPGLIEIDGSRVVVQPSGGDRARFTQYAPPEKLLGKTLTPASDVFSIGAILFHAIAGRPPFAGDTPTAMMLSVCADNPADLRALRDDVPADLATAIYRALAKEPAQRYATPALFAEALGAVRLPRNAQWEGKRLLVADDDAPVRALVAQVVNRIGVEADILVNGRDVVDALKKRRCDLALLDLNMPRLDGWGVLDFLRARRELKPRHLFIVTGFTNQMVSAADHDLVDAVLYKPVMPDVLRELITACLGRDAVDVRAILRETPHRLVAAG